MPSLSELSVPLTAQHLHEKLLARAEVYLQLRQLEIKMLDCERYPRFGSCWFHRKMVCWGGVRPRPGPLLPPLEGGGRQPCTGLLVVLPPVRKSPVRRACCACCRGAHMCRKDSGHGGGAGRAPMHVADAPAHGADVCHVRARLSDCRARCQRAPASLLCVGCRCDVQCGAMRVDALADVPPVQPR